MLPADLPDLAIVRVLTSGGPYAVGDAVAVAFKSRTVGRLAPCPESGSRCRPEVNDASAGTGLLPETISVKVELGAGPYARGDLLTLSFVDARVARIHATASDFAPGAAIDESAIVADALVEASPLPAVPPAIGLHVGFTTASPVPTEFARSHGVRTRLSWHADRAQRFVQVCDKLFTVDRLGWYRHAFAMRLLVADEITVGDPAADREAAAPLQALRTAVLQTLGRPLLAAFMPNFSVTAEWLFSLDDPATARAVCELRAAICNFADGAPLSLEAPEPDSTYGTILNSELDDAPMSTVEAFLPLLIANVGAAEGVTEKLTAYRNALIELFGQTSRCAEAVRLNQMAQPNHTLDDRLWQLVGVIGKCFGGLAVA